MNPFRVKPSRLSLLAAGCLGSVVVGLLDFWTGTEINFAIFYLLPILALTWYSGILEGIFICIVCATTWLIVDTLSGQMHSGPLVTGWNVAVYLVFFLSNSIILGKVKNDLLIEKASARQDHLTGLANRRAFSEFAEKEIERCRRYKRPLSFAFIDFDRFKLVNDRFGHKTGDQLLRALGETLQKNIRAVDTVSRLAGDEFGLLLPETASEPARLVIDRLKNKLAAYMKNNEWDLTCSIGLVTYHNPPASVDEMIQKGDQLMYEAKNKQRDTVKQQTIRESEAALTL